MYDFVSPKRAPMFAARTEIAFGTANVQPDDALAVFQLLEAGKEDGIRSALVTVVDVIGGSARGRGAHMAVLADGRYCGYVSGGCVEAAVAAEAVGIIEAGRDEVLRIGSGSHLMDVRLPCGGGIDLHIHVDPDPQLIKAAIEAIECREPFRIAIRPDVSAIAFDQALPDDATTGWTPERFERIYRPRTRTVLIGRGLELESTARVAIASGFDVVAYCADEETADAVHRMGAIAHWLSTPSDRPKLAIDPYSAVVFLFHDHDWEMGLMPRVLQDHTPFFVGALGSRRTHAQRVASLERAGVPPHLIAKVQGPVGLFGPTRDAASLALSILAQVTRTREQSEIHAAG